MQPQRGGALLEPGADAAPDFEALRIAYLADPGSVHVQRWLGFFAERGHEVVLLVPHEDLVPSGLHGSVRVVGWESWRESTAPSRTWLPLAGARRARGSLRAALEATRPDILHAHYLTRNGWFAWLSGFHPFVATAWGSDLLVDPGRSLRGRLRARLVLRAADLVTVPSMQLGEVARELGAPRDHTKLVRFGVDTDAFHPGPVDTRMLADIGLTEGDFILAPRAIRPLYRTDVIVRAAAGLATHQVVVMTGRGADAAYAAEMQELARSLGVSRRIKVLAEIDDPLMRELYRAGAAVVSVPESDGLPISVIEAMASGTPPIVSDLPGPREALGNGLDDLVVPVGDSAALAATLKRLMAMAHDRRVQLGTALRRRALEVFDQRRAMLGMERLYREVSALRRVRPRTHP